MTGSQTPGAFAASVINDVRDNLNALQTTRSAGVVAAVSTAQAQLAIAAALLDVASAIRESSPGPAVASALRDLGPWIHGAGR